MEFNIEVEDRDLEGFTEDALIQLEKELKIHSDSLIKEAILFEAGQSEGDSPKEITANYVKIVSKTNKVAGLKKPAKGLIAMKVISTISLTVVGFFFEYPFSSFFRFALFLIFIIVGTFTTVIVNMKENN